MSIRKRIEEDYEISPEVERAIALMEDHGGYSAVEFCQNDVEARETVWVLDGRMFAIPYQEEI